MTQIDCETFVKSILGAMWMLNDIPKTMRKNLHTQLGIIWLLISDRNCFPSIDFTSAQQQAICTALEACNEGKEHEFKYTYEALLQKTDLKLKQSDERQICEQQTEN